MVNFSVIPVFVTVVESGSFSLAGERLGITKSAISKRINQLERDLGVQLIHRSTRRLSLTEAGEQYYDSVRKAFDLASEAEDNITERQNKPSGSLRINAPMAFGRLHLSRLTAAFLKQYPDINVDLMMDDKIVGLVADRFDIAIRIGDLADSSLVARRLAPCRRVLCASPEYVQRFGLPDTPEQLHQHNCLFYSYFQAGSEWGFIGSDSVIKVLPRGNFKANNSEAIREALLAGLGIADMPTFIVGPDLASGSLIPLMSHYRLPEHAIYAVFPERKHLPTKVRVFIDFLLDQLDQNTPYWDAGAD